MAVKDAAIQTSLYSPLFKVHGLSNLHMIDSAYITSKPTHGSVNMLTSKEGL